MPTTPGQSAERLQRDKEARLYRRARRKQREAEGEIKELNIVAMMDMMTIILVFLLKSYQASAINVNMSEQLTIPQSTTQRHPQENITVTLSTREVAVNERRVVHVQGGVRPRRLLGIDQRDRERRGGQQHAA